MPKFNFDQIKILKWAIFSFIILILLCLSFSVGYKVGHRKAAFSYKWSENYHKLFGGPKKGFGLKIGLGKDDLLEANGAIGTVIKIENDNFIIKGKDNVERSIRLLSETVIRKGRSDIKPSDLKIDDQVVVIGSASSTGQIEAKMIRVFPAPSSPLLWPSFFR